MAGWQTEIERLRSDQRPPLVLAAFLALLLLWAIGDFITTFKVTHHKITETIAEPSPQHLHNLAQLHLFGIYGKSMVDLPVTSLQFTLVGTVVVVEDPKQSRALITSPNEPAKVYQVGNTLPGNASITRIAKDYVVLNDNGTLEKLALPIKILTNDE